MSAGGDGLGFHGGHAWDRHEALDVAVRLFSSCEIGRKISREGAKGNQKCTDAEPRKNGSIPQFNLSPVSFAPLREIFFWLGGTRGTQGPDLGR